MVIVSRRPHVAAPCVGPAMFAEIPTPEHITGTLKNTVGHSFHGVLLVANVNWVKLPNFSLYNPRLRKKALRVFLYFT